LALRSSPRRGHAGGSDLGGCLSAAAVEGIFVGWIWVLSLREDRTGVGTNVRVVLVGRRMPPPLSIESAVEVTQFESSFRYVLGRMIRARFLSCATAACRRCTPLRILSNTPAAAPPPPLSSPLCMALPSRRLEFEPGVGLGTAARGIRDKVTSPGTACRFCGCFVTPLCCGSPALESRGRFFLRWRLVCVGRPGVGGFAFVVPSPLDCLVSPFATIDSIIELAILFGKSSPTNEGFRPMLSLPLVVRTPSLGAVAHINPHSHPFVTS